MPTPARHSDLISVILPAYNAEGTVEESIRSACAQQGVELEVIVVDDGSRDRTADRAAAIGPPVRVVRQPNAGVGAARNRALAEARGRWVAFLDADDLWLPDKLTRQLELLAERGRPHGFCYGAVELIDAAGRTLPHVDWTAPGPRPEGWVFRRLLLGGNFVTTSSVLVERELLQQVGPFLTDPGYSEDYEMWLRLARWTPFAHAPQPLVRYRFDPVSYSHGDPQQARLRSLRAFDRAAQLGGLTGWRDRLELRGARARLYYDLGCALREQGQPAAAARWLLAALGESPLSTPSGLQLAALAVPERARRLLRGLRR